MRGGGGGGGGLRGEGGLPYKNDGSGRRSL